MKVAIVGYGFVGRAVDAAYINTDVEMLIVDPHSSDATHTLEQACAEADVFFVCVPTPPKEDGSCDASIVDGVLRKLSACKCQKKLVILKSTLTPDYLEVMKEYKLKLVYNPEFLRESHYVEDYLNTEVHIMGGLKEHVDEAKQILALSNCRSNRVFWCHQGNASLAKYAINSFLAMKTVFMNEMYELQKNIETKGSYEEFIQLMSLDSRIGDSHMNVPGPDGYYGFGGKCFPKDTKALIEYAKKLGCEVQTIEQACIKNEKIRKKA
jgi:UDPglucose 6-dehydrogenase